MEENKILMLVDESYVDDYCTVCIVCVQGEQNLILLTEQLRQIAVDPSVSAYNKAGIFHFTDNSISARQTLASWISKMPISAYIAITKKTTELKKQDKDKLVYQTLFPKLLKPLVMKFSKRLGKETTYMIRFENLTDKLNVDQVFFEEIIKRISGGQSIKVQTVTKDTEPLIFLPDYFLGFVNQHLKGSPWSTDTLGLLSGKIGLILISAKGGLKRYERGEEIMSFLS